MKHIVIIGGGFAGLWSAVSAARQLGELGELAQVTLVNLDRYHSIRVRNYEVDLSDTLIDLEDVLAPIGVDLVIGRVSNIDTAARCIRVQSDGEVQLDYDKLILASGSKLTWPDISGLREHAFDIDTYAAAMRLRQHIDNLAQREASAGQFTALVIGSGATGVELATELPEQLTKSASVAGIPPEAVRVILADRANKIAAGLGGGQSVIEQACTDLGVEMLTSIDIVEVDGHGVRLSDGRRIEADTVVWCGGMQADVLTRQIAGERDTRGRLNVDPSMQVVGQTDVFAAGDAAHALIDGERSSVMSCQHAPPDGAICRNKRC